MLNIVQYTAVYQPPWILENEAKKWECLNSLEALFLPN